MIIDSLRMLKSCNINAASNLSNGPPLIKRTKVQNGKDTSIEKTFVLELGEMWSGILDHFKRKTRVILDDIARENRIPSGAATGFALALSKCDLQEQKEQKI